MAMGSDYGLGSGPSNLPGLAGTAVPLDGERWVIPGFSGSNDSQIDRE
tara:strand:+ start:3411 stop:3554 length:144 start_codon:yes stop_codon:yes gene_type:complete